jgi:hypothetical protein
MNPQNMSLDEQRRAMEELWESLSLASPWVRIPPSPPIKKGLFFRPFFIGGAGRVDEPTGFDKNRSAIFGRRGPAAAVRSEAEDERPSRAASNPTLSATKFLHRLFDRLNIRCRCAFEPRGVHARERRQSLRRGRRSCRLRRSTP